VSTYSGTLIAELLKIGIDTTDHYSIEEIVDIITAEAEPLPQCSVCERPAGLTYCKHCREWFCLNGCIDKHDCNQVDGPSTDPLRG
jgi:hypothetical protein